MTRTLLKTFKEIPETTEVTPILEQKGLIQITQNFVPTPHAYGGTTSRPGTIIGALDSSITTTYDNTSILYELSMSCEVHHDNVFVLQRIVNGVTTEIGSGLPAGGSAYGFAVSFYDNNQASTPERISFRYLDTPNVVAGSSILYRVRYYGAANHTLALNRTLSGTTNLAHERSSSVVLLTELGL